MGDWVIPPGGRLITREEYVEHLTDASMREADMLEEGFAAWAEIEVPKWRELGRDESWIRERVASAQSTRALHDTMKERGFTRAQRREVVRAMYTDMPRMYDLMLERERADAEPRYSIVFGNQDVQQRYVARMLLYDADKANYARHCRWAGRPESEYVEDPDQAFIRDFSTVEELEFGLQLATHLAMLYETTPPLDADAIGDRIEAAGRSLRKRFIKQHGYPPEKSTTPRIPVTPEGPVDPDEYRARLKSE